MVVRLLLKIGRSNLENHAITLENPAKPVILFLHRHSSSLIIDHCKLIIDYIGGYSLVVKPRVVVPITRVQFPVATQAGIFLKNIKIMAL